jgi:catechol 2,3-dioxygenase-like lactoylglutathione lyase family enzyme
MLSSDHPGIAMAAPFRLLALDHVVLRVADLARARAFYCDVLGCAFEKWQPDFGLLQLRAGTSLIDLVSLDGRIGRMGGAAPGREARNVDHFCLRVEPFDEAALRAHLAAHGVQAGEVVERYGAEGNGPSLYLSDPDGNTVELKGPAPRRG